MGGYKICEYCGKAIGENDSYLETKDGRYVCYADEVQYMFSFMKYRGRAFTCPVCGVYVHEDELRFELPDGTLLCSDGDCQESIYEYRYLGEDYY